MSDPTSGQTPEEDTSESSSDAAFHARLNAMMKERGAERMPDSFGGVILPGNGGPGKRADTKRSPER